MTPVTPPYATRMFPKRRQQWLPGVLSCPRNSGGPQALSAQEVLGEAGPTPPRVPTGPRVCLAEGQPGPGVECSVCSRAPRGWGDWRGQWQHLVHSQGQPWGQCSWEASPFVLDRWDSAGHLKPSLRVQGANLLLYIRKHFSGSQESPPGNEGWDLMPSSANPVTVSPWQGLTMAWRWVFRGRRLCS